MKHALFAIALLALQIEAFGQDIDPATAKSKIEKFQNRVSSLIQKEYIDVSLTRTMSIQVVKMTLLPEKKEAISGILMSWGNTSIGIYQETGRAYLDSDEIDAVIQGIDAMSKLVGEPIPPNYTELELSTRTGMKLTLFPSKSAWNLALEHEGHHKHYIFAEDLFKIRESLASAKSKF